MIKVHVVSGFLGAGKTTFIARAAAALIRRGEKAAVIENEIGEAGIDSLLLSHEGFKVYELLNGCICCTLKSDFQTAFLELKEKIRPDRVLIEPSGIFVLDSLFDILQSPKIAEAYELASVLTVVDARHYLRHEENYGQFLKSQVENATKLLLTRAEGLQPAARRYVLQSLRKLNPCAEIVPDYRGLDEDALLGLLEANETVCRAEDGGHAHVDDEHEEHGHAHEHGHTHAAFETYLLKPQAVYTQADLEEKLSRLTSGEYGTVIRAKGFVKSEKSYYNANYVDGDVSVSVKLREVPVSLQFIGLGLATEKLKELFL
jgi:G3E family GTPase